LTKGWAVENPHYMRGGTSNRLNLERAQKTSDAD